MESSTCMILNRSIDVAGLNRQTEKRNVFKPISVQVDVVFRN